ncbi:MAG TPA: aromatic amino acid lyase, partial [Solirubrobacteraceae bacterium]
MTDRLNTLETADDVPALRLSNDGEFTLLDIVSVSRHGRQVQLGPNARSGMAGSAKAVASATASPHAVYGVNTGVGQLASTRLAAANGEREQRRQRALIESHAAGLGDAIERDVVRAMILLRARTLARSRSGARPEVVDLMIRLLNADITPFVPE